MHYIDIDVSTKKSAPCIVDGKDKSVRETKLPSTYMGLGHLDLHRASTDMNAGGTLAAALSSDSQWSRYSSRVAIPSAVLQFQLCPPTTPIILN